MTDYDSRRTGNGLLDTGSTPVWSTLVSVTEPMVFGFHFGYSTRYGSGELPSKYTDLMMKRRLGIMSFRFIIFWRENSMDIVLPEIVAIGVYNSRLAVKNKTVNKNRKKT